MGRLYSCNVLNLVNIIILLFIITITVTQYYYSITITYCVVEQIHRPRINFNLKFQELLFYCYNFFTYVVYLFYQILFLTLTTTT